MDSAAAIAHDVRFIAKHHKTIEGKLVYALKKAKLLHPNTEEYKVTLHHKKSRHCRMVIQIPSRKILITVSGEQNIPDRALRMTIWHGSDQIYGGDDEDVFDRDKPHLKDWKVFIKEIDDAQKVLWRLREKLY